MPQLLFALGRAYQKLGNYNSAIDSYRASLKLQNNPTVLYALGMSYLGNKSLNRAAETLEKALALNPLLTSIYRQLAEIYTSLGEDGKSARALVRFNENTPKSQGESHFRNGLSAYFERRYTEALAEFMLSTEVNPSNASSYSNIGYIFFDTGNYAKAFEYQKKALEIDPNSAEAHYGLALAYRNLGQAEQAIHHWREYLRIEPNGSFAEKAQGYIRMLENPINNSSK
jgi:tetratricopeptide (TPR) repeat protein